MTDRSPRSRRPEIRTLLILAVVALNVVWLARIEAQLAAPSKLDQHHAGLARGHDDLSGLDGFSRSVNGTHPDRTGTSALGLSSDGDAYLSSASGASISLGFSRESSGVGTPGLSISGDQGFDISASRRAAHIVNRGPLQIKAGFDKKFQGFGTEESGGPTSGVSGGGFDVLIDKRRAFFGRDSSGSAYEGEGASPSGILILDSGDVHLRAAGISVDLDAEETTVTVRSGDSLLIVREDEIDLQTAGRIRVAAKKGLDLVSENGDVVIRGANIRLNERP